MERLLLVLLVLGLVVGVPVARVARRVSQRSPEYRSWLVAVAIVLLAVVAVAATQLDRVIPDSMRESPAGLFPVLGAVFVLAVLAISAFSLIAGVILSRR